MPSPRAMVLFAILLVLPASYAGADTIQFTGAPTGVNDGSFYVLPYQLTIDGSTQNVVCYDFFDEVSNGDAWQANILNIGMAATSGFFGSPDATAQYERVAWLTAQTWTDTDEQIGLQYAIWNVFDPGSTTSADALQYEQEADAAAGGGYNGFDFTPFRFIQEIGVLSGQPGTMQAFVYETSAGGPDFLSVQPTGAPEPRTWLMLISGGLLLFAGKKKASRITGR
jgi:hypothetical protein